VFEVKYYISFFSKRKDAGKNPKWSRMVKSKEKFSILFLPLQQYLMVWRKINQIRVVLHTPSGCYTAYFAVNAG